MIAEVRRAASQLSEPERAELAVYLLGSLDAVHHWVDDEEVMRRSEELDSGTAKGLSRDEFTRACGH